MITVPFQCFFQVDYRLKRSNVSPDFCHVNNIRTYATWNQAAFFPLLSHIGIVSLRCYKNHTGTPQCVKSKCDDNLRKRWIEHIHEWTCWSNVQTPLSLLSLKRCKHFHDPRCSLLFSLSTLRPNVIYFSWKCQWHIVSSLQFAVATSVPSSRAHVTIQHNWSWYW